MQHETGDAITQRWIAKDIVLSYCIAVTGSLCTIQLMEKWRSTTDPKWRLLLLALAAVALGGCGIWSMHFRGMNALELTLDDDSIVRIDFDPGLTVLSFVAAVAGVFVGLQIACKDPFFLEIEQERRSAVLKNRMAGAKMSELVDRSHTLRKIKIIALFSRLHRILLGAAFAAAGVLVMHYVGMLAQRSNAMMVMSPGLVALSAIIALFTATAAFWIIFRALTFFAETESLRLGSALIMGVAVCGTHYLGMGAASYTYMERTASETLMSGKRASEASAFASLFYCYWVTSWSIASNVRTVATVAAKTHVTQTTSGKSPRSGYAHSQAHGQDHGQDHDSAHGQVHGFRPALPHGHARGHVGSNHAEKGSDERDEKAAAAEVAPPQGRERQW